MGKKIKIDADGLMVELTAGEGTTVALTVSNTTGARKIFCTYHTPFEGIRNEIFEVCDAAGDEIPYAGMMAKRAAPGPEDYITLANGAFESSDEVDLNDGYDLTTPGTYTVKFAGNMICGLDESNEVTITVSSPRA